MDFLRQPLHRPRRRARARGFTLIELMVVVVIIGILAAIAVPGVVERLRQRRANQAAQEIALMYRTARMRALGHGSAVMVHYNLGADGFEVREAVLGTNAQTGGCAAQPAGGCVTNNWTIATQYAVVDQFKITRTELQDAQVGIGVTSPAGAANATYLDICFTPRGRTFTADSANTAMVPMSGVATVGVNRPGAESISYIVTIPPNGIARVAL